jgi:TatD DNase family protein
MASSFDAHSHLPNGTPPTTAHRRVVCGTRESDWNAVLAHAASDVRVIPMLGLHPWFVSEASPQWAFRLESLLRDGEAGVGECGLDFSRKAADRDGQEAAFRLQLCLAHDLQRPVAMHVVQAWGSLLSILKEVGVPSAGALVHAYSGSSETARALTSRGIFLSFSGEVLNTERAAMRESLVHVDLNHLLLETDGQGDLQHLLEGVALLRGIPAISLAEKTWENGLRCFKELMA